MEDDLAKIEKQYDSLAKEWSVRFSNEHEKKPKDQEILKQFSQKIGKRRPVWELGCGIGNTAKFIKNLGVEISGLDLSEKMLEEARSIHPGIEFKKGNILRLEFENDSIAGIVAFYAFVHFTKDQLTVAFQEIYRVLKPGGLFLFTFHVGDETIHLHEFLGKKVDLDFMFFTADFISRCLLQGGFRRLEQIEREPYPDLEYQSKRAYVFAEKPLIFNHKI